MFEIEGLIQRLTQKTYSPKDIQEVASLVVKSQSRENVIQFAQPMLTHSHSQVRLLGALLLEGLSARETKKTTDNLSERELGYRAIGEMVKKWLHEKPA